MRHVFGVHPIGARHLHEAPGVFVGLAGLGVARVHHRHAVHVEAVAVGAGRERSDGRLPHAVGALGHRLGLAKTDAGNVSAAAQLHRLGLGGQDPERDLAIRRYFRRNNLRPLSKAPLRVAGCNYGERCERNDSGNEECLLTTFHRMR